MHDEFISGGVQSNMGTRLAIGFGLVLFQQFTGQPNIIYYAADVFRYLTVITTNLCEP